MVGLLWEPDIPPLAAFLKQMGPGREITPDMIRPEDFFSYIDECYVKANELPGDMIQRFTPAFGIPWMEAIVGCHVIAHPDSLWAESVLESLLDRPPIRFIADNPWFVKLLEFTRSLVAFSNGRFPVAVPQMRGPLDILAALRTPAQMCVDLLEEPEYVSRILGELTDLWIAVGQAVLEIIPPFAGGCMARMGAWAPGKILTTQNDVSTMISSAMYKDLVLPWDRKIVSTFPYTEFHLHSTEHHQVDNLLTLEDLTTIELTLEHTIGGPPLEKMLEVARRVLQSKPLILAALDIESAHRCLRELPHEGLLMTVAVSGPEIPEEIIRWLKTVQGDRRLSAGEQKGDKSNYG